jgi:hypothetical protein
MRRVTIKTDHGSATQAERVAQSVRPDNTAEMTTRVDGQTIETVIERETTGGAHSTADDYVVNLEVAAQLTNQDGESSTNNRHDT